MLMDYKGKQIEGTTFKDLNKKCLVHFRFLTCQVGECLFISKEEVWQPWGCKVIALKTLHELGL